MHPDLEVIAATSECRNGNCPTVWRNSTIGAVRLRGQDPSDPTREIDIEWSGTDFALLAPRGDPAPVTDDEFDALFNTVTRSAFRYEGLPVYAVDEEDADLAAWRLGLPMAERSVRTDPWLARIARQTVMHGVDWCRVRYVTSPPSWYVAWEISGYVESQAAGERIYLTGERVWDGPDFWLLDAGTPDARGILQRFDERGAPVDQELVTVPAVVRDLERATERLIDAGLPLNAWIVEHRDELYRTGPRG